MASPTASPRVLPTGYIKLREGFPTTIALSNAPGVGFWEETIKVPAIDGGEPIDTTTMLNANWRTLAPRKLKKLDPFTINAGYDPNVLPTIINNINIQQTITVWFPDGGALAFYGYMQKFDPGEMKEGTMPLANITFVPTNYDHVNEVEAGPVYTAGTGT